MKEMFFANLDGRIAGGAVPSVTCQACSRSWRKQHRRIVGRASYFSSCCSWPAQCGGQSCAAVNNGGGVLNGGPVTTRTNAGFVRTMLALTSRCPSVASRCNVTAGEGKESRLLVSVRGSAWRAR
jgi:hypothetical protein